MARHRSTRVPPHVRIIWTPETFVFRDRAEAILRAALSRMRLAPLLRQITVHVFVDDFGDEAHIQWSVTKPYDVRLDIDMGNFLTADGRAVLGKARTHHSQISQRRFSRRTFEGTVLHELSHLKDDVVHGIDCWKIPHGLRDAFNEVWNVWIDGRLRRRGHPTVTKKERRAIFRDLFGRVRGRRHHVFETLWKAERLTHQDLVRHMEALAPAK